MKTSYVKTLAAFAAVASMTLSASTLLAQDSSATSAQPAPAAAPAPAPQLAYGVAQILQLSQAKIGDDTIIAYIKNSGNSYGLSADQIIYLRQQGLSSGVINAMLTQPPPGMLAGTSVPMPSTAAPPVSCSQPVSAPNSMVGPSVSAIDPTAAAAAAASYYYYPPYYYPAYSYPYYPAYGYYGYYPGVSVSLGWRGGGGWGGWGGGWHGGYGGFHGGFHR
jgi:hypothetical protein